jgi:hypothetical protein
MSGWNSEIIEHEGVIEPGTCFLAKPFSKLQLAEILQSSQQ